MGRTEAGAPETGDERASVLRPPSSVQPAPGFRLTTSHSVSTREAAHALGCNVRTIRRAIARGDLTAREVGSAYRIDVDELLRFAAGGLRAPPAAPARLTALPAIHHLPALPEPLSSFVGRDADLAGALALVTAPAARVVTLTGPGGIGKTRLALAVAAAARAHVPDGVAFIPLAAISRSDLVIPAICWALGLRETASHDWRTRLLAFLAARRMLLVIDNVEHLLEAVPELTRILTNAPRVALLATSRSPLRVDGERELPVAPLSLPEPTPAAIDLLASDATRLFIERARARDPSFTIDAETAPLIAEICTRLEGLPLAIELAAAQVKTLSPRTLRDRLERRLSLLTAGARDAPRRHRTMRDAIAWSYELLAPDEQELFRRLAVFAGDFTLNAAEAVGGDGFASGGDAALRGEGGVEDGPTRRSSSPPIPLPPYLPEAKPSPPERSDTPSFLDLVASLVDQSLLTRERGPEGEPRFRMLETIREYGLERLDAADVARSEAESARAAHARHVLAFARALRPLANTQATRAPFDRLAAEDANTRAALGWLDERGPAADFVGLVVSCWVYWYATGHVREAEGWLNRALAKGDAVPLPDGARLAIAVAELLMVQGEAEPAVAAFAAGLALMREANDPFDLAMALKSRAALANVRGGFAEAERFLAEALSLAAAIEDERLRAAVSGEILGNLSVSAREQGQTELAADHLREAMRHFSGKGFELAEARTWIDLADTARDQGDMRLMVERYLAGIEQTGVRGEQRVIADALCGIAIAGAAWGQDRAALLLFSAAAAVRERAGIAMVLPDDAATFQRQLGLLRETLGDDPFAVCWAEGQALSISEAVAVAAKVAPPGVPRAGAPALTRRERDVLRLLAAGRTDREIAAALYIGPRTVSWHVSALIGKLAVSTRHEAVARARALGVL